MAPYASYRRILDRNVPCNDEISAFSSDLRYCSRVMCSVAAQLRLSRTRVHLIRVCGSQARAYSVAFTSYH